MKGRRRISQRVVRSSLDKQLNQKGGVIPDMNFMRHSACLVVNPISVDSYCFLFNSTAVGQASDLMTALT